VPPNPDLIKVGPIKIAFASGPAHLNREMIERVAAIRPDLQLLVVGEFEPHRGQWIPYHPLRGFRENLAAVRVAVDNRRIETAAMILAPSVPLAKMRLIALAVAGGTLIACDEKLQVVRGTGWVKYAARRALDMAGSHRTKQWIRRLRHPGEGEVPVRARAAPATRNRRNHRQR
jgi:hypothetical protein